MVVTGIIAKVRSFASIFAAAAAFFGANPALANSSAATADIAAPLRAAQAERPSPLGNTDEQFRQLFKNWQSLDNGGSNFVAAAAPIQQRVAAVSILAPTTVSIPSRMPVEGVHLTSDFGMRWHPVLGGRRQHKGIDLAGPVGTPVHATADGVISRADWFSSYGLFVSIEHGGNLQTRYGHMSRLNVAAGQMVHKGDIIGFIGTTGRSTGPHLHYEVRIAGEAVNPVPYLQADEYRLAAVAHSEAIGAGGPE